MAALEDNSYKPVQGSRDALRAKRRRQLIESTIDSIAAHGFAETTLANVARGAGLSRGIVNFHFQSKEMLLIETLQHLSRAYRTCWRQAYDACTADPVERLVAIFKADFDPVICNPRNIAVWFAFWGEAKSRPVYSDLCGGRDNERNQVTEDLCRRICAEGGYALPPETIARGLESTAEGLWQSLLMPHRDFDRDAAEATMMTFLSLAFPEHIGTSGEVLISLPFSNAGNTVK